MKATILLPELNQKVTLHRGEMMYWLRRGVVPKWYAALYVQQVQQALPLEEIERQVSKVSVDEMLPMFEFENALVEYAIKGTGITVSDLSPEEYDIVLAFAKNGRLPETAEEKESEGVADVLETFRTEF